MKFFSHINDLGQANYISYLLDLHAGERSLFIIHYQQMLAKSTAIESGRVIARQLRRHVSEEAGADAKQ